MGDEEQHAANGDGGGDGGNGISPSRSRGERREFADVVVAWATAVAMQRALVEAWESCVADLQRTGRILDGDERSDKVADLLKTIRLMRKQEERSAETRTYLNAVLRDLTNGDFTP